MCGIIAAFNLKGKNVNQIVIDQYEDQHTRGTDGFGIVTINDKTKSYKVHRATEPVKALLDLYKNNAKMILMHHRYPTSSENQLNQTHPIMVDNGSLKFKYLVVHNGVVSNDDELKEQHENELGFVYNTKYQYTEHMEKYNDSECVAIEVARFAEGQTSQIGASGSIAFIGLKISKKTDKVVAVIYGRNTGSPLNADYKSGQIFLSSTGPGDSVEPDLFYNVDIKTLKRSTKKMSFYSKPVTQIGWSSANEGYWENHHYKNGKVVADKSTATKQIGFTADEDTPTEAQPFSTNKEINELVDKAYEDLTTQLNDFFGEVDDSWEMEPQATIGEIAHLLSTFSAAVNKLKLEEEAKEDFELYNGVPYDTTAKTISE